jgi:hypothetical protein
LEANAGALPWFAAITGFVAEADRAYAGAGTTARVSAAIRARLNRIWEVLILFIETILLNR